MSTPKFRSLLEEKKVKKGISVVQKETAKYEKYMGILAKREWIKWYANDAVPVF